MKKKTRKKNSFLKPILAIVFLVGVLGGGAYFLVLPHLNPQQPVNTDLSDKLFGWKFPIAKFPTAGSNNQIAYSNIRDPGGIPQGLPVRLKIPIIGVDSAIEDALITPDGRMDVPVGSVNVAWFSLGPHPGKEGSAVIGGHFGITNGKPFVFYNLDKLKVGDKVYVENDAGETLAFIVRRTQSFDRNADATTVFTSQDGIAHLNLITCEGLWNQVNDTYPQRLVVFTDAIPTEGAVQVKPLPKAAAKVALPKTAIIAGSTPTPMPSVPPTPVPTAESASQSHENDAVSPPQILIASVKSLYATVQDGLITSFLIVSIVFLAFKIVRR